MDFLLLLYLLIIVNYNRKGSTVNKEKVLKLLREAESAYYNADPVMTDAEYDELVILARREWPDDPDFIVRRIGAAPERGAWEIKQHSSPMGSIDNILADSPSTHIDDVLRNGKSWWLSLGSPAVLLQHKMDGLSVDVELDTCTVKSAILRGDGLVGEDILRNFSKMQGFHKHTIYTSFTSARCEIVVFKRDLEAINAAQVAAGDKPYDNCRNAASGIARRLDGKFSDKLTAIAFDIRFLSKKCDSEILSDTRVFSVPTVRATTWEEVEEYYKATLRGRDSIPYDIDGIVIKVDSLADRHEPDSMLPSWIRALKFPPEEQSFRVDEIQWFVGKTGKLTPVIHNFIGVQFKGKVVNFVTLHNYAYFCRYRLAVGDRISVAIAGDVIPHVEDVLSRGSGTMIAAPKTCPCCGSLLRADATNLYCDAVGCSGRVVAVINAHIKEMGIEEVGPELVDKLHKAGQARLIRFDHFPDLYRLTVADIMKLEGFQSVGATKVVDNIRSRMQVSLSVFVASLGIPGVGAKTVEKIPVSSLSELMDMTVDRLQEVDGIGKKTAVQIKDGLSASIAFIGQLLQNGVTIKESKQRATVVSNILNGKAYCFTGDPACINVDTGKNYTREDMQALVVANGGVVKSGVSKKLDVLVLADMGSGSSKARKAKELGVEMISAKEFFIRVGVL